MNTDIQTFIDSYKNMADTYRAKVKPDNPKLRETDEYLKTIAALGNSCKDIGEFMTAVTERDMMGRMTALLSDLAIEALNNQRAGGTLRIPSSADAALGYHKAYEAMADKEKFPETCRVYERVFQIEKESADAGQFVSLMAQEGLYVKMATVHLVETFRPLAGQADNLSIPVMAYHNESMLAMAGKATSAIEVEYESQRLLELNRVELMCDTMFSGDLFYTLGNAVSSYLLSPTEENRQAVENSCRFIAEFFSIDDGELFAIPRVIDLIDKVILPGVNGGQGGRRYTRESFIAEQRETIRQCLKGKPPVEKGPVARGVAVLWGKTFRLKDMLDTFRKPQRPENLKS